jgi:hypothetical protein
MTYTVTITSSAGQETSYECGGADDQAALIYAGKVVEANADSSDPSAAVTVLRNGTPIGPAASVAEMTKTTI